MIERLQESHLVWSVGELPKEKRCVLQGIETEFGIVSPLDLELSIMLHPNDRLLIPAPRSHFIKYAPINKLVSPRPYDRQLISDLFQIHLLLMTPL